MSLGFRGLGSGFETLGFKTASPQGAVVKGYPFHVGPV